MLTFPIFHHVNLSSSVYSTSNEVSIVGRKTVCLSTMLPRGSQNQPGKREKEKKRKEKKSQEEEKITLYYTVGEERK